MAIKYDMVVKTGEYEVNGETKSRWLTIGRIMTGRDGGFFAMMDAHINLAGLPHKGDAVLISLFDHKEREQKPKERPPKQQDVPLADPDFNDDVPF